MVQSFSLNESEYQSQLFHAIEDFVTEPSSTAAISKESKAIFLRRIVLILLTSSLLIFLWLYEWNPDTFVQETLTIQGSIETGNSLFRMNCVGCHGITAQGLVGPDLHRVTYRLSDPEIINQVVKGLTPPMPSFEIESQSMADLLAYMHSLN